MNIGIFGIDASYYYNKGFFSPYMTRAEQDFMLVSAHEFGHSVLQYFDGVRLSWSHKGTTHVITQSVKSNTPGYPLKGSIDLMKYYDSNKRQALLPRRFKMTLADEQDVKRLIWLSQITFVQ